MTKFNRLQVAMIYIENLGNIHNSIEESSLDTEVLIKERQIAFMEYIVYRRLSARIFSLRASRSAARTRAERISPLGKVEIS